MSPLYPRAAGEARQRNYWPPLAFAMVQSLDRPCVTGPDPVLGPGEANVVIFKALALELSRSDFEHRAGDDWRRRVWRRTEQRSPALGLG